MLGQFYTTNAKYILQNLLNIFPQSVSVIDPFAGQGDLLRFFKNGEGYDIEPKNKKIIKRDTLLKPLNYENKWIITNPPFLAKNKNSDKTIYEKYNLDDLYKISLKTLIGCEGGIIILPVNFFSSLDFKIRKEFLSQYKIKRVNIFEETVFDDTTYTICAFNFIKSDNIKQNILFTFYPTKNEKTFTLKESENYMFGYEIYNLQESEIIVNRLLKGEKYNSKIFLKAIDDTQKINLSINDNIFYGKKSDRSYATIKFNYNFTLNEQKIIVDCFNNKLNYYRKKYNSLFLSNYRDNYRKRISFKLAYKIISNCILENNLTKK